LRQNDSNQQQQHSSNHYQQHSHLQDEDAETAVTDPLMKKDHNLNNSTQISDKSNNKIDLENINKQIDQRSLIERVKNDQFFKPDLSEFTMCFNQKEERKYQEYLLGLNPNIILEQQQQHKSNILISPQYGILISALVSFIINLCVSTAYFLTYIVSTLTEYDFKTTAKYKAFIGIYLAVFLLIIVVQLTILLILFKKYTNKPTKSDPNGLSFNRTNSSESSNMNNQINNNNNGIGFMNSQQTARKHARSIFIKYLVLHFLSFFMIVLVPIFMLCTGFPLMSDVLLPNQPEQQHKIINFFSIYFYFCYIISTIHFCAFVQLNSLFKSLIAALFALIAGVCVFIGICSLDQTFTDRLSGPILPSALFLKGFMRENFSVLLDLILLTILILLVNRQSELILRVGFKCDQEARLKIKNAKEQKELTNWLIEVVLPNHVVGFIKEKKQYSQNYDSVGVLFVSLCNFSEFFEEAYEGGRELLRVLNEITIDFDRMFDEPRYKNIEKIKSIGSTYMIASGLCPDQDNNKNDEDPMQHLYDLFDFALELYEKLESFNNEAMSVCHFKFQMRMGLNYGPVTAGVIGTERLLYDIWGDTVNVASRMDSTGQSGFIQTPDKVAHMLKDTYTFIERGTVQIKGKDQMLTYLMNPKENVKKNSQDGGGVGSTQQTNSAICPF
jgi:class 3 adenylate cyclase